MEKIKNSCSSGSSGMRNVPKKLGSKQLPKSHLRCKQSRRHFSVNFTMCLSVSHFTQWVPPTESREMIERAANEKLLYIFLQKEWRHITRFRTIFVDAGCGYTQAIIDKHSPIIAFLLHSRFLVLGNEWLLLSQWRCITILVSFAGLDQTVVYFLFFDHSC